jgi:hypothetical protein
LKYAKFQRLRFSGFSFNKKAHRTLKKPVAKEHSLKASYTFAGVTIRQCSRSWLFRL